MLEYSGKSAYKGIAIGKIKVLTKQPRDVFRKKTEDTSAELSRFESALTAAKNQLKQLYEKALGEVGESGAAIFEIHQMMLEDDDYLDSVKNIITEQKVNVEYAVATTSDNFSLMFSSMDDDYMKERAADVKDVSERIINILCGAVSDSASENEPFIILADDLAPSETVQLDKDMVLAFVTVHGSTNSHTAILARTMNIPALVSTDIDLSEDLDGKTGAVDGFSSKLYIDPDENTVDKLKKRINEENKKQILLEQLRGKDDITADGKHIMLYANIGNLKDMAYALANDAGGIGLFRSEFIYLESNHFPTEEEQFNIYKKAAETMAGKRLIIRTLDIGADKQADYFNLPHEENPAMGMRAIRICLTRPDIFRTQLRAIYRASMYGRISVMYPMITSVEEVYRIKKISEQVRNELRRQGIPFDDIDEGIMIETPAAVMISDLLAKEVDFFSIGTNDLSQYTLAVDRQNPSIDEFYNPHHTAIIRMIESVCENAHKNNIWVGICGELGADINLTEQFLRMGIDELSVSPSSVLPIREKIRSIHLKP